MELENMKLRYKHGRNFLGLAKPINDLSTMSYEDLKKLLKPKPQAVASSSSSKLLNGLPSIKTAVSTTCSLQRSNYSLNGTGASMGNLVTPTFTAISVTVVFILSTTANGLVLYLFSRVRNLKRKPFYVFVLNLTITNFVYCIWENAFDIGAAFSPSYWKSRSSVICSVYLYSNYMIQSATCNAHLLITLNRLWAILFPHSYRTHQKVSVFVAICMAKWIFVHVIMLPGLISDGLYYREDPPATVESTISAKRTGLFRNSSQKMLLLTLLTVSVMICWTPNFIAFTLYSFIPLPDDLTIFIVVTFMYSVQALMDPVLFLVALRDLRIAFLQLLTSCNCRK
ncbi:uncharacterized protein LOC129598546 [Paramacrobiotus metropolitanus]|uniref:uncharacterized protein LOC129598546 n=1 Tax=Paramacrobiotus metropolitanus TaxID=2943436 RepID=UPI002445F3DE|nr:uncharacterized protein LOC129598546 [Paramacrobiotus metropolitanus]